MFSDHTVVFHVLNVLLELTVVGGVEVEKESRWRDEEGSKGWKPGVQEPWQRRLTTTPVWSRPPMVPCSPVLWLGRSSNLRRAGWERWENIRQMRGVRDPGDQVQVGSEPGVWTKGKAVFHQERRSSCRPSRWLCLSAVSSYLQEAEVSSREECRDLRGLFPLPPIRLPQRRSERLPEILWPPSTPEHAGYISNPGKFWDLLTLDTFAQHCHCCLDINAYCCIT